MSLNKLFVLTAVSLLPALASAQSSPVLQQVLSDTTAAYNKQERPMVVFDIEGTLLDNRPRILQIMKDFAADKHYVTPAAAAQIQNLTVPLVKYRLPDTLASVGVTDPAVVNNAAAFWAERFFTDDYLKYDQPVPGAVEYVRTLYSNGARIIYVTGRDQRRQLLGTVKSLRDHGFPIGIQGTELIMKPTVEMQDAIFKQNITNYLRHYGTVVATIDSDSANANVYRRAFNKATVILFESPTPTPNPPPLLENIMRLASF
jgi:hypothetical protein